MRARPADLAPLIVLLLLACSKNSDDATTNDHVQPEVEARTAVATERAMTESIGALGTIASRAGHTAALGAPGLTRVTAVRVSVGQHVRRGTVLVQLDGAAFAATLQGADAQLAAAERAAERAQRLSDEGILSRRELDQAQSELALARASAVGARRTSDLATLRSPIAGIVTRLQAPLGATVDANQPLVEIADPSVLDVVLGVSPSEAARVRPGARATLFGGTSASADTLGTGKVADVGGTVDSSSRTVAVRVALGRTRRTLRIGEAVFAQVLVGTRARALTVPAESLVPSGEGYRVFVVDSAGIAHVRAVEIGVRADSVVEITRGLAAGERVVSYGAFGVDDSVKVIGKGSRAPRTPEPK